MNSALDSFSRRYQNNHYYTATSLSANTTNNNNNVNPSLRHETRASLETPLESSRKIGRMTSTRDAGKWRFLYCQANGMASQDVRNRKVDGITKIIEAYDINGAVFCETCVNWSTLPHNKRMKSWFDNMMEREIQVNTAHNIHAPRTTIWQPGGTGMLFTHELLQYAKNKDNDFRGLGRWSSWVLQSNPTH